MSQITKTLKFKTTQSHSIENRNLTSYYFQINLLLKDNTKITIPITKASVSKETVVSSSDGSLNNQEINGILYKIKAPTVGLFEIAPNTKESITGFLGLFTMICQVEIEFDESLQNKIEKYELSIQFNYRSNGSSSSHLIKLAQ